MWVLPLSEDSPRDVYVAWHDWRFKPGGDEPDFHVGSLAQLVFSGAVVVDEPRRPPPGREPMRVVVHRTAHVTPVLATVSPDGNFVTGRHFLAEPDANVSGPYHVSRLVRFNGARASKPELTLYQVEAGSGVITEVLGHRTTPGGPNEFYVAWLGTPLRTWVPSENVKSVRIVIDYCAARGLPTPGSEPRRVEGNEQRVNERGRGRGRPRGQGRERG